MSKPFTPFMYLAAAGGSLLLLNAWSRQRAASVPALLPALDAQRGTLASPAGPLGFYSNDDLLPSDRGHETPLLLLHDLGISGSSYEMKPLFDHYARLRPVYALDLPGFGFSERSDRDYTARTMIDAIISMSGEIHRRHDRSGGVDVIALGATAEYLARAALERSRLFRSAGMIAPGGFDAAALSAQEEARAGTRSGLRDALSEVLRSRLWSRPLFDVLTMRTNIRLRRMRGWGASAPIDSGLVEYDYATARQPGARFAPLGFAARRWFGDAPLRSYLRLQLPVWVAQGTQGRPHRHPVMAVMGNRDNWKIDEFDTGALPHFERLDAVVERYDAFLADAFDAGMPQAIGSSRVSVALR